jgi:hypothetical protein
VPATVFFDGFESGTGHFTLSVATGSGPRWQLDAPAGPFARSGLHALFGDDLPAAITDARVTMNEDIVLPHEAFLHFSHAYALERYYDGGVVEYSTDGGATWSDGLALFDSGGYDSIVAANANPLGGRRAFSGDSHGYRSARMNLSALAGQNVRFRWRLGLDENVAAGGWFLDDVRIYSCPTPPSADVDQLDHVVGATPGVTVALRALIENTGSSPLPPDAQVRFQVDGPSLTDSWVGSISIAGQGPGSAKWYTFNWAIPTGTTAGTYRYHAQVWTSTPLSPLKGPQEFALGTIVEVTSLWGVTGARPSLTVPLWALVKNVSTTPLPADARVRFRASGPSFDYPAGDVSVADLAPGAMAWYVVNWKIQEAAGPGSYEYSAQVWSTVAPISPPARPQPFVMGASWPSWVTHLDPVPGAARGATVSLRAAVENIGATPLPADARVWFWVSGPGFSAWVGSTSVAGQPVEAWLLHSMSWTIPRNVQAGTYEYRAQVWTASEAISPVSQPQSFFVPLIWFGGF